MTMMLIYYWMARKYLFYYCDVNWCCCVVREVVNLSITGWIDKKYKYNLASDTILHRWKYRRNVSIGIFQWRWEQFLFFLTLFMMLITHGYTDRMFPSVYSSSDENYSLLKALIIKDFFTNRITHEMGIPMPLQLILFFTVVDVPQWNYQWNRNSKALVINALFNCWLFTLLPTESLMKRKIIGNIWRFLKFFVWIENFNLTSQVELPIEILKILLFNIPSRILLVKPNIKDHGHSRWGFISSSFILSLFFSSLHSLIFVHDRNWNQTSSSLLILIYVVFLHFSP